MNHKKLNQTKTKGKNGLATFLFSRIFIFSLMIALKFFIYHCGCTDIACYLYCKRQV